MATKKLDLNRTGNAHDRLCQEEARPSSGSATPKHKLSASQSNGAGSASKNAGQSLNGMAQIMPGGAGHSEAGYSRERTEAPKSKTPNKAVQRARNEQVRRENCGEDTTGKRRS
jgi:hypothetical protein